MSTTVTGKLNKAAREKVIDSGDSLFLVQIGKKEYDRQNSTDVWANYSAAVFAKQGKQTDYYRQVLAQGSIVSVSGSGILPTIWGDSMDRIDLKIIDPVLEYANNPSQVPANAPSQQVTQQPAPVQQAPVQQAPQAVQQQSAPATFDDFNDDIPF